MKLCELKKEHIFKICVLEIAFAWNGWGEPWKSWHDKWCPIFDQLSPNISQQCQCYSNLHNYLYYARFQFVR